MQTRFLSTAVLLATLLAPAAARAITFGEPDTGPNAHPYVGLVVFYSEDPETGALVPEWRCSGTLISPTVFLTAGHCTASEDDIIIVAAAVYFGETIPASTGYPFTGGIAGTPITFPDFQWALPNTGDVGVVVLDPSAEEAAFLASLGTATLACPGTLDALATRRGQQDVTFTSVGYGLQSVRPSLSSERVRLRSEAHLVNLRSALTSGFNIQLSNNPGEWGSGASGGTCFGDSGGPLFYQGLLVGITSFGLNQNCKGTDFSYRTDTAAVWSWLQSIEPSLTCETP